MDVAKVLNRIITNNICGPTGDPDWSHLRSAADAYLLIKHFKLELTWENEQELIDILRKKNVYEEDFLADDKE